MTVRTEDAVPVPRFCRTLALAIGIVLLTAAGASAVACGGGIDRGGNSAAPQPASQRVISFDRVLTIDDVTAAGAKRSKEYDVTGLASATGAWLAFFGPAGAERSDFELRFYPSHGVAVRDGTALADQGVGDGMRAHKDTQTWNEGMRERWFAGGVTDVSSPGSRQAPGPKYGDYVILGNLIMLCQGADSNQSLERCAGLVEALRGPKAEK
ncbi:MAG: hypothetical protein EXR57_03465 [Dehalococcoidia bacterium]|nr:hypothetical protein [Dehalococcoidia bacterium]MSQ34862.1 hypothetical protein [Dehalococcoidia bacterium]